MTVTLSLRHELEAGLTAQARANGMELEDYLLYVVEEAAIPGMPGRTDRAAAVRGMLEFGEKYRLSLGQPVTRDLLHEGHRF